MKKYIKPNIDLIDMEGEELMESVSTGVVTGKALGNAYNSSDESYSKQIDFSDEESIW